MDFEIFSAEKETYIFVPDAPSVSQPPPPPPPLPPLFSFLLFYLRSLSEGLTISSSVSPLSCSAVYCL